MTRQSQRWLALPDVLTLLILTGCVIAFSLTVAARDFLSYWAAGVQLVHHASPYDAIAVEQLQHSVGFGGRGIQLLMRNPPTALPLALPLGLFSYKLGGLLWSFALLVCLIASVLAVRALEGHPANNLHILAYCFGPAVACLLTGQTPIFVLLGLVLFLRLHLSHPLAAGASLWLCFLKPHLFLPFGVALLAWIIATRSYRILIGAVGSLLVALALVMPFDPSCWTQYRQMMQASGIVNEFIPCWSDVFRRAIDPRAMWIQFVPAALACVWALWYFLRHRRHWSWIEHGSLLMIVSVLVAPYAWLIDQSVLIPALLHALYRSRSRAFAIVLGSASALIILQIFLGASVHSRWNLWPAPLWLVWYLFAVKSGGTQPQPAGAAASNTSPVA
ncbi:MAG TPA: glycosyltransferase 87 family protein [Acidobacteriaceae bacterium]|nr:glycosyltransferase 87 family protein [Acidobacteriaceae bacterium]